MTDRDGGPAFPNDMELDGWGQTVGSTGMTLRDWFAGQAMAAQIANSMRLDTWDGHAETAYRQADAMLAERAKPR